MNCFSRCGLSEATPGLFIDDDNDAGFVVLQNFISEISSDSTVDPYLNQDEDTTVSVNKVDVRSTNWKWGKKQFSTDLRWWRDRKTSWSRAEKQRETEKQAQVILDDLNSFSKTLGDTDLIYVAIPVTCRFKTFRLKNVWQKNWLIIFIKLGNLKLLNISYMKTVIRVSCIYLIYLYFFSMEKIVLIVTCFKSIKLIVLVNSYISN